VGRLLSRRWLWVFFFSPCLLHSDAVQEREARRRSREIDVMLARERRAVRRLVKILLLGAGESGKSTFLKQMRIINGKEFDKKALLDFRDTIFENIIKYWGRGNLVLDQWCQTYTLSKTGSRSAVSDVHTK
uniref:Uncharacterized protein n=1 Tax=Hucho hucho TaxID=62062 RepID=A0A4W5PSW7_9TELE